MAFLEEPRPNSPIDSEMEDNPTNNIRPYQFEPEWPADEHEEAHQFEDNEEQEFLYIDDESRRDNLEWWVLQTAWYQYKQQYEVAYDGPEDKLYRHVAYRQLARWCWGVLGREVRVILPSYAVTHIRETFPLPGLAEEFQFEGFHYVDE
ncbi:uncharacterized protein LOC124453706 isoform X2 [Xenia sp. Carnegie-2017]|uniref:uncharacterized protein LOC124453706 isoform X2 n=1 Tax=Xenia sp. Carnegie-2017 TaxID=2897299 RepID=UPI001F041278|nr:uncharacterized protein LOC124453706 isoform X2 [Xenia sp. Carnegie-2017]